MGIITRSKSIALAATATLPPATSPIKYNNTKIRSRAKSRSTAFRSVSLSPINLKHNKLTKSTTPKRPRTTLRTRSDSSSSSSSSSLNSLSRSSSSSSATSTDSILY